MTRVVVCGTQVPFARGGAEILVESLVTELSARGYAVDLVQLPFSWTRRTDVLKSALAWRLLDLRTLAGEPIDLVIATRFPAYLIRHPNKVVWLIHQFRQVYDLAGTPYSEYGESPEDRRAAAMVRAMDERALGEARALYSISRNTAARLARYNQLAALPLYPPPKLGGQLRAGAMGDYVLAVGRLDKLKRFDGAIEALAHTASDARLVFAGTGPEEGRLTELAERRGVAERVIFAGFVDDQRLLDLYAGALAVYYAPFDEDYGYVTVEAMRAGKPVLTTRDAGGVLEFVEDGATGFVCAPESPRQLAAAIDRLRREPGLAEKLGGAGRAKVAGIGWDEVITSLTGGLPP